jgi:hypothetical protein
MFSPIFAITTWAHAESGIEITIASFVCPFNWPRYAIGSASANRFDRPKSHGRYPALGSESDANVFAEITKQTEKCAGVTGTDVKNYCCEICKFEAWCRWVDSFILRHSTELAEKKSSREEEPRPQVPRVFPDETIRSVHETVESCTADSAFSLDKVGISDWEGQQPKKVLVPRTAGGETIHHRISRNVKRILVVTCISPGGAYLTPCMVTSQDSVALRHPCRPPRCKLGGI